MRLTVEVTFFPDPAEEEPMLLSAGWRVTYNFDCSTQPCRLNRRDEVGISNDSYNYEYWIGSEDEDDGDFPAEN